ncbi:MAG: 3-hydroxyacyl-CoA dehydrogenase NAD-binding domain-containing protein [Methanothrix sp.]
MAEKISIIGPGTMGTGIAQTFLQSGFNVILIGRNEESAKKGLDMINAGISKAIAKGSLKESDRAEMLARLTIAHSYEQTSGSVLVVEAVSEILESKIEVLKECEKHAKGALIASNTSSISITRLGASLSDPEMFIGMHFFNPVPVMKPVEVIAGEKTSQKALDIAFRLSEKCGKTPIKVNDYPGFVANSILMPMLNEAMLLLERHVATKEGIDSIVKLGLRHPMGPLELADFIGLDVCLDITNSIYKATNDEKYKPANLLVDMVNLKKLGKKTGEGFYKY